MNRKNFLVLLVVLLILGGAGLLVFWQDLSAWRSGDTKIGSKPFEKLAINNVAQIHLTDSKGEVTLLFNDGRWVVKERAGYSANYPQIGELLIKLTELKVVQTEQVGPTLLPRLELAPTTDAKSKGADTPTVLELSDKSGKVVAKLTLGKKIIKTEDSPLPIKPQKPVGRYVLLPGSDTVLIISDALTTAEAKPERWLAKDFFKVDRISSLAASGRGAPWKLVRSEEFVPLKFATGAGALDMSAAASAIKALESMSFEDLALNIKRETLEPSRTVVAETYDGLTYTVNTAKKPDGDDYYVWFTVSGEPRPTRIPEKGEKPEDAARDDKRYAEDLVKLKERLKLEKSLAGWTYVVAGKNVEPLLKDRADLVAQPPKPEPRTAAAPGRR